jgi:hypothetical protein
MLKGLDHGDLPRVRFEEGFPLLRTGNSTKPGGEGSDAASTFRDCRGMAVAPPSSNGRGSAEASSSRKGGVDEASSSRICRGTDEASSSRKCSGIREEDFISYGMYQIAKHEEHEWRLKQAEEIKSMLFRSPQSTQMNEAIKHIQSNLVFGGSDTEDSSADDL